ncbi:MAG TPA: DcrB-related protein [bacterium]|nr:DcrB-related protein [bacterium]
MLAVAAALFAGALAGAPAAGQPGGSRLVHDPADRFTIAVPASWNVRTSSGDPAVVATGPPRTGELPETVNVIARDTVVGISSENCVREAARVMRVFGHIEFATVSQGPTTVGDLAGYTHAYTWRTKDGEERWSLQVCVVMNREAFVMTGTTTNTATRVEEDAPLLTKIMGTFRLTARGRESAPAPQPGGDRR